MACNAMDLVWVRTPQGDRAFLLFEGEAATGEVLHTRRVTPIEMETLRRQGGETLLEAIARRYPLPDPDRRHP